MCQIKVLHTQSLSIFLEFLNENFDGRSELISFLGFLDYVDSLGRIISHYVFLSHQPPPLISLSHS